MVMMMKMGMILILLLNITGCVTIHRNIYVMDSEDVKVESMSGTKLEDLLDSKIDTKLK